MNENIQEKHKALSIQEKKPPVSPMTFYKVQKLAEPMSPVLPGEKPPYKNREELIAHIRQTLHLEEDEQTSTGRVAPIQKPVSNEFLSIPASPPASDSLAAHAQRCGILPASVPVTQPNDQITVDSSCAGLGTRTDVLTPMTLVNKVKSCLVLCVKDHVVFLYQEGCYRRMSQNDMEEVIWKTCEFEVNQAGSKSILSGAYQLLTVDPSLRVENLRDAQNIVPFKNGLLNLENGFFMDHCPTYFITYTLNCEYPSCYATDACPAFDKYLLDVSGSDASLIARIWQFLGYCLTQDVNAKAIFVLQGVTGSGKSVMANLLKSFFPREVVTALDAHDMGEKFAIGECEGKMLCLSSDMPAEAIGGKAVSNLKKLSGRDTVSSAVKYQNRKEFFFTGKIVLVTNNPLLLKQDDQAFWERIVAIPFRYQIPRERRIDNLEDLLMTERPAIASKALRAYRDLRNNRYRFSGNFEVNDQDLYPDTSMVADPATMVFLYLQRYYEPWGSGIVVLEKACEDFNKLYGVSMSQQQFSTLFHQQAYQMYGAVKKRTREGGYENARSAVSGIKRKFI